MSDKEDYSGKYQKMESTQSGNTGQRAKDAMEKECGNNAIDRFFGTDQNCRLNQERDNKKQQGGYP